VSRLVNSLTYCATLGLQGRAGQVFRGLRILRREAIARKMRGLIQAGLIVPCLSNGFKHAVPGAKVLKIVAKRSFYR